MRKIVASLFMTLDGVVESPNLWAFDFGSPTLVGGLAERGLLEARGFGPGVVLLRYAPAGGQP